MFTLTSRGQLGGLMQGVIIAAVAMFVFAFLAIVSTKTKSAANSESSNANSTFDNISEGTEDGSDMGKILLFALPAIAVLGLFIGLTRLI